jgi:hypothetical protein
VLLLLLLLLQQQWVVTCCCVLVGVNPAGCLLLLHPPVPVLLLLLLLLHPPVPVLLVLQHPQQIPCCWSLTAVGCC